MTELVWILGKWNPADIETKFDSSLTSALRIMLLSSALPFDFDKAESRTLNRSLV